MQNTLGCHCAISMCYVYAYDYLFWSLSKKDLLTPVSKIMLHPMFTWSSSHQYIHRKEAVWCLEYTQKMTNVGTVAKINTFKRDLRIVWFIAAFVTWMRDLEHMYT